MKQFETHVISLKGSTERQKSISVQCKKENLNFKFFEAKDGRTLENINDYVVVDSALRKLTKGEIGCALSHMALWHQISNSEVEWHLILEDDCVLSLGIKEKIGNILRKISQNEVVMLYWRAEGHSFFNFKKIGNIYLFKANAHFCSTVAYLVHKNSCKMFYDRIGNKKISIPIDSFYGVDNFNFNELVDFYLCRPYLIGPGSFDSVIDEMQIRSNLKVTNFKRIICRVKQKVKFLLIGLHLSRRQ